jgi:hypothetical protein
MGHGRKNVRGACATGGDDSITFAKTAEQKFEGTNFVSCAYRCVEIVTLDPQLTT